MNVIIITLFSLLTNYTAWDTVKIEGTQVWHMHKHSSNMQVIYVNPDNNDSKMHVSATIRDEGPGIGNTLYFSYSLTRDQSGCVTEKYVNVIGLINQKPVKLREFCLSPNKFIDNKVLKYYPETSKGLEYISKQLISAEKESMPLTIKIGDVEFELPSEGFTEAWKLHAEAI